MAESHILITLFHDLKAKIHDLNSKNAMMDAQGIHGMKEIIHSCDTIDRYIDSFIFKEEHIINVGLTYDTARFTLSPTTSTRVSVKPDAGPTPAMRRYAEKEEKKVMDRIDQVIQMGRQLDANQGRPYFSINY